MITRRVLSVFLAFTLLGALLTPVKGQSGSDPYKDAPSVLEAAVGRVAEQIVRKNEAGQLDSQLPTILFYTLADAMAKPSDRRAIRDLEAYQYLGETARTDKQIGASASSEGTTSAIEKPGFADLLGFAIEHGAITQEVDDTSLTLSTTPYAFVAWAKQDLASTYEKYGWLSAVNLLASFNLSDEAGPPLTNAKRSQLSEWSVKLRLNRDRSSRSKAFQKAWKENAKPLIARRLNVLTGAFSKLFTKENGLNDLIDKKSDELGPVIEALLVSHLNDPGRADQIKQQVVNPTLKDEVVRIILTAMHGVYTEVQSGTIVISDQTRKEVTEVDIPALFESHDQLKLAREWVDGFIDTQDRKPQASIGYTFKRQEDASNYSIAKIMYEQSFFKLPVKLNWNTSFSFYHDPDPLKNQETWRDLSAALSLEAKSNSPFLKDTPDLSKITYSLTGRYQRLRENRGTSMKADIGVAQFKVEIPIAAGVSIPLSISAATATELLNESKVHGHFGFTFDLDKFAAVRKLLLKR